MRGERQSQHHRRVKCVDSHLLLLRCCSPVASQLRWLTEEAVELAQDREVQGLVQDLDTEGRELDLGEDRLATLL